MQKTHAKGQTNPATTIKKKHLGRMLNPAPSAGFTMTMNAP